MKSFKALAAVLLAAFLFPFYLLLFCAKVAVRYAVYYGAAALCYVVEHATWHPRLSFRVMPMDFPDVNSFRQYMATKLGDVEVIKQTLYDTIIYPTAGQANMLFFQNPIGQGLSASPGNANNAKALSDTNMNNAGSLPAPQGFFVQSIEIDVRPGSVATANTFTPQTIASSAAAPAAATGIVQLGALNDLDAIYGSGALQFTIGPKPYLQEAPLLRFPPKCRPEVDAAVGGNSATTANFGAARYKAGGRPYQLNPGLAIMTSQNFAVALQWPVIVATPSGFNASVRVILDGWLFRAVQ